MNFHIQRETFLCRGGFYSGKLVVSSFINPSRDRDAYEQYGEGARCRCNRADRAVGGTASAALWHTGAGACGLGRKASVFDAGVEIAVGRVGDRAALDRAVQGCSAVISALGSSSLGGESSPAEVDRDGVIRLADAAAAAG